MRAGWLLIAFALLLAAPAQAAVPRGWSPAGTMSTPRALSSAVLLDDGRVLVAGGGPDGYAPGTSGADLFDPATGAWSPAAPMIVPRSGFVLRKLASGQVLAAGGWDSSRTPTNASEIYDPATNLWQLAGPMSQPRYEATAQTLGDGRVLVLGGWAGTNAGNNIYLSSAEVFNPVNRAWTPVASFNGGGLQELQSAPLPGGRVLIAGGWDTNVHNDAQTYDGSWHATGSMITQRWLHELTPLPGGRALATGGVIDNSTPTNTAELFDPTTGTWSSAAPMSTPRERHTATALPNGKVLATGGWDGARAGSSSELYDPASNAWTAAGSMTTGRFEHTATLLKDGRVLVTGGFVQGIPTASAELWTPTTSLSTDPAVAGTATLPVTNTGDATLFTGDFALGGANPGDFAVNADRCRTVATGATCLIDVRFTPTTSGPRSATLTFSANTVAGTYAVSLGGNAALDADGDGVPDTTDRCKSLKGSAARQGCPAGLLADPSIRYRPSGKGIRVLAYYVKATKGARLTVKCSRKACKSTVTKGKGAERIRITKLTGRRLRNGTTITITASLKGRLTTKVIDRVSKARRVEGRPRCAPVGC